MEYSLETVYCDETARQFVFSIEEKFSNFVHDPQEEKLLFENMNPYQRMMIHMIAEHYGLFSKTLDDKGYEETKNHDNLKNVHLIKSQDTKEPLIKLRDYLCKSQQEKHELLIKLKDGTDKAKIREKKPADDNQVVFKGRGKTRWKPEDLEHYQSDRTPTEKYSGTSSSARNNKYEVRYVEKTINIVESPKNKLKVAKIPVIDRINSILSSSKSDKNFTRKPLNEDFALKSETSSLKYSKNRANMFEDGLAVKSQDSDSQSSASNNFLPAVSHILIVYGIKEGCNRDNLEEFLKGQLNCNCFVRLYSKAKGFVVCQSSEQAQKLLTSKLDNKFELVSFQKADKESFRDLFKKEYFNIENMRPKADKSAAIRMINGHLKIK